ncbi:MAG: GNAT family N-acetyltransferase [Lachnospiraceae bacterium]|nr:GNAT family N-acetyltransferase [Lachnospiraceae bacterium]
MIERATKADALTLAKLAIKMWEDNSVQGLTADFEDLMESDRAACFIKYVGDRPVGFAQCQLRTDYVEGTETSPVGYLEGIFVEEAYQHQGIATRLLQECQKWAKEMGCSEFASDCELDNTDSLKFHLALGFEEAGRIICFRKDI